MRTVNPATLEISKIEETPLKKIPELVDLAWQGFEKWRKRSLAQRARIVRGLIPLMRRRREAIAEAITADMGKPIELARREVDRTIDSIQVYCSKASEWLSPEALKGREAGYIEYAPLGVVAVISPWNYPFFVPFTGIAPALLAGDGVIFKPSEYALKTGLEIARLFKKLKGFPTEALQCVIGGKSHGRAVVNSNIRMIAFTGSTTAGKDIMKRAASGVKKVSLELGGLDAAVVLRDVDVERTAKAIVRNNCTNSGQVCCAIKRVYVEKPIYQQFVKAAQRAAKQIKVGDPLSDVDMGPLAAEFQLKKVKELVADAKRKGARVLSTKAPNKGYFYGPTLVTKVKPNMRLLHEEPFGPVLPIVPVDNFKEAIKLANATPYGLTGSVWTRNKKRAKEILSELDVGVAGHNTHGVGPVGVPWGGTKQSGIGRTKNREGMRDFTNVKLVRVGSFK